VNERKPIASVDGTSADQRVTATRRTGRDHETLNSEAIVDEGVKPWVRLIRVWGIGATAGLLIVLLGFLGLVICWSGLGSVVEPDVWGFSFWFASMLLPAAPPMNRFCD
jgi:hypothetical protein